MSLQVLTSHKNGDTWLGFSATINLNGSPLDLTDGSGRMQLRKTIDYPTAEKEWNTANSGTVSGIGFGANPASGIVYVGVDPSGVVSVTPYNYYWDLELTLSGGRVVTPISGTWNINWDITRD